MQLSLKHTANAVLATLVGPHPHSAAAPFGCNRATPGCGSAPSSMYPPPGAGEGVRRGESVDEDVGSVGASGESL